MKISNKLGSDEYQKIQRKLHDSDENYGRACVYVADKVAALIKYNKISTLTDYGAGKKRLIVELKKYGISNLEYRPFDISYPEYGAPKKSEMVVCIDVLEHVEPIYLTAVLHDLALTCEKVIYISIHTKLAKKVLADGRNAHLTIESPSWWYKKLSEYFKITDMFSTPTSVEFIAVVGTHELVATRIIFKKKLKKSLISDFRRRLYI